MAETPTPEQPNIRRLLIVGLLIAFVAPAILTSKWLTGPLWYWFHFDAKTGAIGDTFGGIAGPILNFVGLYLVYYSFQQQLEANRLQKKALEAEIDHRNQEDHFNDIKLAIDTFREDVQFHERSIREIAQIGEEISVIRSRQQAEVLPILPRPSILSLTGYSREWNGATIQNESE